MSSHVAGPSRSCGAAATAGIRCHIGSTLKRGARRLGRTALVLPSRRSEAGGCWTLRAARHIPTRSAPRCSRAYKAASLPRPRQQALRDAAHAALAALSSPDSRWMRELAQPLIASC
eukprot:scaffold565_cov358-Prasinococcus_capsulatus_cf.AAC.14